MINEYTGNSSSYIVSFSIKYETKFGQNVYLMGSTPELGSWKNKVAKLKWSEGHIWRIDITFPANVRWFEYKFAIENNGNFVWEKGHNRLFSRKHFEEDDKISLSATWERFSVTFMIYFPSSSSDDVMQIMGGARPIGNWYKEGGKPVLMSLGSEKFMYGIKGRFWELCVEFDATDNQNFDFEYRYSLFNKSTNSALWEREPNRRITLLSDPKFLSLSEEEQEKLFPVSNRECELLLNNNIVRFDPNFVSDLIFNKLGEYPIYIGPYPQNGKDIETLHKTGVTAVINLQSDIDHLHRQINWQDNLKAYAQKNIEIRRSPILDFSGEDLVKNLKASGDLLNELLKKNQVVYVHCTAGMSRAAATVIIYLYYYQYMSFEDAYDLVKQHRSIICPNVGAIKQVIKNHERKEVTEEPSSQKEEEIKQEKGHKEEKDEEIKPKEEVSSHHKKKKHSKTTN